MTGVVLDTHVLIWLMNDDSRLGSRAAKEIQSCADQDGVLVPAIACWEVAMLVSKGRIKLDCDVQHWLEKVFNLHGVNLVDLSPAIAVESTRLPGNFNADPADRLIVATARAWSSELVTADQAILSYGRSGYLRIIDAGV